MTKLQCNNCKEKHDRIHMICECSDCYIEGAKKEKFKEQARILKRMHELTQKRHRWDKLKKELQGEENE